MSSPNKLPVFQPQMGDIKALNANAFVIDMSDTPDSPAVRLGEHLGEFMATDTPVGGNTSLQHFRDKLKKGGTLVAREVAELQTHFGDVGTDVSDLKAQLGHPSYAPISIKSYRGKSNGLGVHRDSNFPNAGEPSVVDAVGVKGSREFGLWAMPQNVQLEGRSDAEAMHDVNRAKAIVQIMAKLNDRRTIFRPSRTLTLGTGQGVRINERDGVWDQAGSGRPMAVWHSVYALHENDEPVITAVVRSRNPRSLPGTRDYLSD